LGFVFPADYTDDRGWVKQEARKSGTEQGWLFHIKIAKNAKAGFSETPSLSDLCDLRVK
jgi:hypothetical protein